MKRNLLVHVFNEVMTNPKSLMVSLSLIVIGLVEIGLVNPALIQAQGQPAESLAFEVASVRANTSDAPASSNFPLNVAPMYAATGGLFSATNFPLVTYIFFAYSLSGNQAHFLVPQLPGWVMNERFDIQARAPGSNPTKDEMRLMMRSLLAERFKFTTHTEQREVPVLAMVLANPGKTGPQLQPHPADAPCQTGADALSATKTTPDMFSQKIPGGFPPICGAVLGTPPSAPGRLGFGGRSVTIGYMADMFGQRMDLGRPMIDATGLTGTYDFLLEFAADSRAQVATAPPVDAAPDPDGPTFEQALRDQLGLKLDRRNSSMPVMVLDHVERPTPN